MREIGRARVCYEGDGGGGGFFDQIKNLFSGATQTAPTTTSLSLGELSPEQIGALSSPGVTAPTGFDIPVGSQDPTGAAGISVPLTGAIQPGGAIPAAPSISTPAGSSVLAPQGPGAGVGPTGGPGGGAVATAAPASVGGDERFATGGGLGQQAPGFSDAVARNVGIDPKAIAGSAGVGTGSTIDTALADPSLKNILKAAGANANILVPAAGLGMQALQSKKEPEGLDAIRAAAAQTGQQSALMQQYLTTGTLPAGLQAGLDQAKEAAKASIRARYANLPGQSSAMEAELNAADQNAASAGGQLAIQLFESGMHESQISSQLYDAILHQSLERDKELSSAMGNFATAMAGGGPSLKLSLG